MTSLTRRLGLLIALLGLAVAGFAQEAADPQPAPPMPGQLLPTKPAEAEPEPEPEEAAPETKAEPNEARAKAALDKASKYIAGLDGAEVNVNLAIVANVHNQMELFSNQFTYAFKRPNLYYRDLRDGKDATKLISQVVSNGKDTTYYHSEYNLYTVEPEPIEFAQALDPDNSSLTGSLDLMTFFAYLIQPDPAAAILENAKDLNLVGRESVNGVEMDKLEMTLNNAKTELWIAAGDKPLISRVQVDVTKMIPVRGLPPNTPLLAKIEYSDWKTEGPDGKRFTFAPPAGAEKRDSPEDIMKEGTLREVAAEAKQHPLVGKPATDFTLPLFEGGQFKLSEHKGQNVVILDFWATWCTPCVISMPMMIDVTNQYKDKGVLFFAVNQKQEKDVVERFLEQRKLAPTVVMDATGKVGAQYGASSIPYTVIVGKDGLVKRVHQGTLRDQDLARKLLVKEIEDVLAGK